MQYDTVGNPMLFYDMCACCDMDTGGRHQCWCPCYQPIGEPTLVSEMKSNIFFKQLVEEGLEDIRQGKYVVVKPLI